MGFRWKRFTITPRVRDDIKRDYQQPIDGD